LEGICKIYGEIEDLKCLKAEIESNKSCGLVKLKFSLQTEMIKDRSSDNCDNR
jgi:hypothetical protein